MNDRETERKEAIRLLDKLIAGEEIDRKCTAAEVALGAHEIYEKRMERIAQPSYAMDGAREYISRTIDVAWKVFGNG